MTARTGGRSWPAAPRWPQAPRWDTRCWGASPTGRRSPTSPRAPRATGRSGRWPTSTAVTCSPSPAASRTSRSATSALRSPTAPRRRWRSTGWPPSAARAAPCGLIRNHEDRNLPPAASLPAQPGAYDPLAGGGTTTLDYDPKRRRLVRSFISLDGTTANCAGGFTRRRRSWLTGEATIAGPAQGFGQPHGYLFEVPADRGRNDSPHSRPLRDMGRFSHEAAATDHRTGIVYETEDPGSGRGAGFYGFIPKNPRRLAAGGRLQILGIKGKPQYDTREGQRPGRRLPVRWIDIPDPDPEYDSLDDPRGTFQQGWRAGAAMFNRLEGCWYAGGSVFFVSTSGGDAKSGDINTDGYLVGYGQVWEYRIRDRRLILHYESPGGEVMDSPDNLTVTPRGGLMVCEDDATPVDAANANRVIGISPSGRAFPFAENIFTGMTCAITGPWKRGLL